MRIFTCLGFIALLAILVALPLQHVTHSAFQQTATEDYLSWTADQAVAIGKGSRVNGRVGGAFDLRVIHTEHSYNYKLRGTLMTPEVIRATARLEQLRSHLTNEQTRALVDEAERGQNLVALVEIDAREGSGVIPLDWRAALKPTGAKDDSASVIRGITTPSLRQVKALSGVARRDYSYDIFWVVFPLTDQKGTPVWDVVPAQIELVVGIYNKEGHVTWTTSSSLRQRISSIANQ